MKIGMDEHMTAGLG